MTSNKNQSNLGNVSTKSGRADISVFEKDKDMHKRAEDLAGKISATVTITTNSTSKLPGGNTREKNDFLAMQNSTQYGSASKAKKQGSLQVNPNSANSQQQVKPLHLSSKTVLDPQKIIPNLSSLKPVPLCNNTSKSILPNHPIQPSSNTPSSMMATITPIYKPTSSVAEESTKFTPVSTKSSLRDYRKPKIKNVQSQSQIFKTSTNASTNNKFTLPGSGEKHAPLVPDEISVTAVIGPPGNKNKAANAAYHQEPAIISCYPVPKSTTSNKRHMPDTLELSGVKKLKTASSQQDKPYSFPKGLTITEVNAPSANQHEHVGLILNPLNVCATTLEPHQQEEDDDIIPVLHIPETTNISQSQSSISKYQLQQKSSSTNRQSASKISSGINQ